jgi:hydroxymethylpyrimidine kinase/phosphomethylpyrimidine kinase
LLKNTVALTIAGSDSGGGAGIQADLKTFSACGVYGASVITAVTAQNLDGVSAIQAVKTAVVEKQLRAVLEGYPVRAVKTGMLFSREIIGVVADVLGSYPRIPLVIDPVFAATSGSRLIKPQAIRALCERLFPLAALVTPNIPEAEFLCSGPIGSLDDLREAGAMLCDYYGVPFLMKGGHLNGAAVRKAASPCGAAVRKAASPWGAAIDMLFDGKVINTYRADFIGKVNSHGSGCTLSAAVAASLAGGNNLPTAVSFAKAFITDSLLQAHELRPGTKVINHFFRDR